MNYKEYLVLVVVISLVAILICTTYFHNKYVRDHQQWVDAGIVSSVVVIPTAWNEAQKTQIRTNNYTFIVIGIVSVCKNGTKVFWSGKFVYLDDTGNTYKIFDYR